ncbi:MAG: RAMP superfamily CRISPR-associated protein [Bacteroidetes bacterium]|nr:RAMP superfamily CRISPR-associated protein [Bacteroidota bacterium]MCL6101937.1 RAMP superfamily CRISPR-associated protein [Bacteroidota bacterium]
METIKYTITFFSEWHAGSGLTSGSDLDALVIKDKKGLPYIPGRTLKGLLKEAAVEIEGLVESNDDFVKTVFGVSSNKPNDITEENDPEEHGVTHKGECFFSNAKLSDQLYKASVENELAPFYYRAISSTAINGQSGVAEKHSLRRMQTTIPCVLEAEISNVNEEYKDQIEACFKWIKRLGQNRNRGLGRCQFEMINGKEDTK